MIYYLSGPESIEKGARERLLNDGGSYHFLLSFAMSAKHFDHFYKDGAHKIMIDSGAFSAWNSGKVIDREKYLDFIKKLPSEVLKINLDVIPQTGSSLEEKLKCCEASFQNYLYLSKHVQNVIPVHHYGEDISWLKRMLDHTDHVCISPANDTAESVKRGYFDYIWSHIDPAVKVHALGYSSLTGIYLYPFHSTDSISFKVPVMHAQAFIRRSNDTVIGVDLGEYAKFVGMKYDPSLPLKDQKELVSQASYDTIKALLFLYDKVKDKNEGKDWSHLKSQLSLF